MLKRFACKHSNHSWMSDTGHWKLIKDFSCFLILRKKQHNPKIISLQLPLFFYHRLYKSVEYSFTASIVVDIIMHFSVFSFTRKLIRKWNNWWLIFVDYWRMMVASFHLGFVVVPCYFSYLYENSFPLLENFHFHFN